MEVQSPKTTACYIHIPFCEEKCIYCDFYSIIRHVDKERFISALKREISHYSGIYSGGRILHTVFLGGGTPTILSPAEIEDIINHTNKCFVFGDQVEITVEANPGTVDKKKLMDLKNAGVNRISIGVQSFDDDDLKFLTRIHDKKTAIDTIYSSAEAGIENINLDLMFNLPGQNLMKWQRNLSTAVKLPVKHISAYSLVLEQGTILNKMILDGKVKIQGTDADAKLYEFTINFLKDAGFAQYEVSNFAKTGFECRHNKSYWNLTDYLGFGPSAHSFMNNTRWWNYSGLNFYLSSVEKKRMAVAGMEELNDAQLLDDYVMLALRSSGLDLKVNAERFGTDWLLRNQDYINELKDAGYLFVKDNFVKFTTKGYLVCDEILAHLK